MHKTFTLIKNYNLIFKAITIFGAFYNYIFVQMSIELNLQN